MSHEPRHDHHEEERMILAHDPVPGYRPVFTVVFALSCLYLAYVLFTTL